MRKALVVGINYYQTVSALHGCVNDAHSVKSILERHSDGSVNFDAKLLTGTGPTDVVTRSQLRSAVEALFADDTEISLFYFAGHGYIDAVGGYLISTDSADGHDGLSLVDVVSFANASKARNKVIILDSCHSGIAGATGTNTRHAELSEGMTILTASTADQYASEAKGAGVFTTLLVDALAGGAANLVGDITPGSVYAHIDQSLGAWEQRPVFKTNVKSFVSLRKVQPPIPTSDLRRITEFFPQRGAEFQLDPTFEPERHPGEENLPAPAPENTAKFAILQAFKGVNLVVPVGEQHMWHAAMRSKSCRLTVLGEHYRNLVEKGRI